MADDKKRKPAATLHKQGRAGPTSYQPGQSGNPSGRRPGTRNRTTVAAEQLLEGQASAVARVLADRALEGDPVALRLFCERVIPVRRGRPVEFSLPAIDTAADVDAALGAILRDTATGQLTPEEAATVAGVLEMKRRTLETTIFEARLAALEAATTKGGKP